MNCEIVQTRTALVFWIGVNSILPWTGSARSDQSEESGIGNSVHFDALVEQIDLTGSFAPIQKQEELWRRCSVVSEKWSWPTEFIFGSR
mmetsp:Transcript_29561/g.114130  ORF Transcript_29561/g.114130 Transcript_29561/m.114130 type:complete len:89 (-) Transcript_29561:65-331(-)